MAKSLDITPQPHQQKFLECNGLNGKEPIRIVFFGGGAKS